MNVAFLISTSSLILNLDTISDGKRVSFSRYLIDLSNSITCTDSIK